MASSPPPKRRKQSSAVSSSSREMELLSLPNELLTGIVEQLPPRQIIELRLLCWRLYAVCKKVALSRRHVKSVVYPLLPHYFPNSRRFDLVVKPPHHASHDFFTALSSSTAVETLCLHMRSKCVMCNFRRDRLSPVFTRLKRLKLYGSPCCCHLLRFAEGGLHCSLPHIQEVVWSRIPGEAHLSTCSMLHFIKHSWGRLRRVEIGSEADMLSAGSKRFQNVEDLLFYRGPTAHCPVLDPQKYESCCCNGCVRTGQCPQLHTLKLLCNSLSWVGTRPLSYFLSPTAAPALRHLEICLRVDELLMTDEDTDGSILLCTTQTLDKLASLTQVTTLVTHLRGVPRFLRKKCPQWRSAELTILRCLRANFRAAWKPIFYAPTTTKQAECSEFALLFQQQGIPASARQVDMDLLCCS